MRYPALLILRLLDALHWAGCELTYLAGGAYHVIRRRIVRYIAGG